MQRLMRALFENPEQEEESVSDYDRICHLLRSAELETESNLLQLCVMEDEDLPHFLGALELLKDSKPVSMFDQSVLTQNKFNALIKHSKDLHLLLDALKQLRKWTDGEDNFNRLILAFESLKGEDAVKSKKITAVARIMYQLRCAKPRLLTDENCRKLIEGAGFAIDIERELPRKLTQKQFNDVVDKKLKWMHDYEDKMNLVHYKIASRLPVELRDQINTFVGNAPENISLFNKPKKNKNKIVLTAAAALGVGVLAGIVKPK